MGSKCPPYLVIAGTLEQRNAWFCRVGIYAHAVCGFRLTTEPSFRTNKKRQPEKPLCGFQAALLYRDVAAIQPNTFGEATRGQQVPTLPC